MAAVGGVAAKTGTVDVPLQQRQDRHVAEVGAEHAHNGGVISDADSRGLILTTISFANLELSTACPTVSVGQIGWNLAFPLS